MAIPPETLDVTLALDPTAQQQRYRASWSAPGLPLVREKQFVEFDDALFADLKALTRRVRERGQPSFQTEEVGERLFHTVFPGDIRRCFEDAYRLARKSTGHLRLRLQLTPELENLPFELLHDPSRNLSLGANLFVSLVRGTAGKEFPLVPVQLPLRLLVVVSQPEGVTQLNTQRELQVLNRSLKDLQELRMWEVVVVHGPDTLSQLRHRRDAADFHVLHFIGHGAVNPTLGKSNLVFEDLNSRPKLVDSITLSAVLAGYTRLSLIVLNSCFGGHVFDDRPYASIAHELLKLELAAVVAMQREVADESAILFCHELYRGIGNWLPIDRAVNSARLALKDSDGQQAVFDWFNPQVYLRALDGCLFEPTDSSLPWEKEILVADSNGDVPGAVGLFHKTLDTPVSARADHDRLRELARRLAESSQEHACWDELSRLLGLCQTHAIAFDGLSPLEALANNRRYWQSSILSPIQLALSSADIIAANLALEKCDRLIHEIIDGSPAVSTSHYGGDTTLFNRFWTEDVTKLRRLRNGYQGQVISKPALQITSAVDSLLSANGIRLPLPRTAAQVVVVDRESWAELVFRHRIHNYVVFEEAKEWIKSDHSHLHDKECLWLEDVLKLLAQDSPLLLWTMGNRQRAINSWEERLTYEGESIEQLAVHHHLAVADASASDSANIDSTPYLSKRAIRSWAILLSGQKVAKDYWSRLFKPRVADGAEESPTSSPLDEIIGQWLLAELADKKFDTQLPDVDRAAVREARHTRDMEQYPTIKEETGCPSSRAGLAIALSPRGRWFSAELLGATLAAKLSAGTSLTIGLLGGCGAVSYFGRQQQLSDLYSFYVRDSESNEPTTAYDPRRLTFALKQSESRAKKSFSRSVAEPEDVPFQIRAAFSSLRYAWQAVCQNDRFDVVLECLELAAVHLPPAVWAATQDLFRRRRGQLGGNLSAELQDSLRFEDANPAYTIDQVPPGAFVADWQRILLTAWIDWCRQSPEAELPWRLSDLVQIVESVGDLSPTTHSSLREVQAHLLETIHSRFHGDFSERLHLLQLLGRLGLDAETQNQITSDMLQIAADALKEDRVDQAVGIVSETLRWNPASLDAREVLSAAILNEATRLFKRGDYSLSKQHLLELLRVLRESPHDSSVLQCHRLEAEKLEQDLQSLELTPPAEFTPHLNEPNNLSSLHSGEAFQVRLNQLHEAKARHDFLIALDYLNDSALLAPDVESADQLARELCQIIDTIDDPDVRLKALSIGIERFPNNPELGIRLRALEHFIECATLAKNFEKS
jgi:hypothetical protein